MATKQNGVKVKWVCTKWNMDAAETGHPSGDVGGGGKTITATSEAVGVGNADFSHAYTTVAVPTLTSGSIAVQRGETRLNVNVTGLSTGASMRHRVYVDAQDEDHLLMDETIAAAANTNLAEDVTNAIALAALFGDGNVHTFYHFLWKTAEGIGDTTVTTVQTWYGIGSKAVNYFTSSCPIKITHTGQIQLMPIAQNNVGGGTTAIRFGPDAAYNQSMPLAITLSTMYQYYAEAFTSVAVYGSAETDLNAICRLYIWTEVPVD